MPGLVPIVGYADRKSVAEGQEIAFKVSVADGGTYSADLVRIIAGDPNPASCGVVFEDVSSAFAGEYDGVFQETHPGSYAVVDLPELHFAPAVVTLGAMVWPTLLSAGEQTVVSLRDRRSRRTWTLAVDETGVVARVPRQDERYVCTRTEVPLLERHWYRVAATIDTQKGVLSVFQRAMTPRFPLVLDSSAAQTNPDLVAVQFNEVMFAAAHQDDLSNFYNGKIERPYIVAGAFNEDAQEIEAPAADMDQGVACWDFSKGIETQTIRDIGPNRWDGVLVNCPMRAMTGSGWDATAHCWTQAPEQYGAIHFHDDDLLDAGWQTSFAFRVPGDLPSGIYGARMTSGDDEDVIPFFVRRPLGSPTSRLAFWVPTFTYEIYANFVREPACAELIERIGTWGARKPLIRPEMGFGLSCYNNHADGSAVSNASARRPDLTMRPGYLSYLDARGSGLRHFPADLHLAAWLNAKQIDYDVITDHDVDDDGAALLEQYDVVVSGAHPEYHTDKTREALATYQSGGGRYIYVGGNGFYWRIARSTELPDLLELRRAAPGTRRNHPLPGEDYHAVDGMRGGLWRSAGKDPQQLLGVGFAAQGVFYGEPYTRSKESYGDGVSWIFDGVDAELIGDHGFSGGGAAGFELDRADCSYGSPPNTVVLASCFGNPEKYIIAHEEHLGVAGSVAGLPRSEVIRSDMVFFETPKGGAVFSAGSITFCGSLPTNDFDNDVSRVLENVVRRFLDPTPF